MELYKTVKKEAEAEQIIEKSRFTAHVKPVETKEEADEFIASVKSRYKDATHNVPAMVLGDKFQIQWASDDGEPQGTAGIPTLDVLQKADITDAVVVVTRYFGGILLGGGGLVRAYSHAASLAVEASGVLHMRQCLLAELICDYTQYGKIASLIPECVGVIDDTVFEDTVQIKFHMAHEDFQAFEKRLADTTCGAVKAAVTGKEFFAVSET